MPLPNPGNHWYRVAVAFCCILLDDSLPFFFLLSLRLAVLCLLFCVTGRSGTTIRRGSRVVIGRVQVYRVRRGVRLFFLRIAVSETGDSERPAVL